MSAKKKSQPPQSSKPAPATPPVAAAAVAAGAGTAATEIAPSVPWIESSDPRRRMIGKIALVAIWIYVAALWLLALDQWFNWGIFGPKVPPVP